MAWHVHFQVLNNVENAVCMSKCKLQSSERTRSELEQRRRSKLKQIESETKDGLGIFSAASEDIKDAG